MKSPTELQFEELTIFLLHLIYSLLKGKSLYLETGMILLYQFNNTVDDVQWVPMQDSIWKTFLKTIYTK